MTSALKGLLVAGATFATASVMLFSPSVGQAQAGSCSTWKDSNTFGAKCNYAHTAHARCHDGSEQYGLSVIAGRWSYAYCSGHGGLSYGWVV